MALAELVTMPDIREYKTIDEASRDKRVPYTAYWIRRLCQDGKIVAKKFGVGKRTMWLVHMPSLLEYARTMADLGTQKHVPQQ